MTLSQEIIARYTKIEREVDALGRTIGVSRLKPSQQARVAELTPGLAGEIEMTVLDEKTGEEKTITVSKRLNMTLAAAVVEIDGNPYPPPRTRGELDALLDVLDREGIEAAMIAYSRLFPTADKEAEDGKSAAGK